ncbi:MAG TPA: RES family NAD+ phosphorylase [Chitinophagaceae bacterium]|nr:RES family NAD+ phosphorylase [Chitinophagaceae bacterium]
MIVYRFSHPKYANDISGTGAKLKGGRWNIIGLPLLYTSESISLCLLEVLANANTLEELQLIQLVEIDIPTNPSLHEIHLSQLKNEWWKDFEYSQWIGSEILKENKALVIKCPSAIIEMESNYLINPLHVSFKKIGVNVIKNFRFDERLF